MKVKPGDTVKLSAVVTRVGEDGLISVRINGFSYPISLYEEDIEEVVKAPKERNARRKPLRDVPD